MKLYNEKLLSDILDYIKSFSLNYGRSPSYRDIKNKFSLSSLSLVSRYVDKLCEKGYLKKSHLGGIDFSYNYKLSQSIIAPIVGYVRCGQPILAQENLEGICQLPTEIFGKEECFILHAQGDSMEGKGIKNGDLLVVAKQDNAKNGDIVVALIDDSATVKTFYRTAEYVILHAENPCYQDIKTKNVKILGVVKQCIHNFC